MVAAAALMMLLAAPAGAVAVGTGPATTPEVVVPQIVVGVTGLRWDDVANSPGLKSLLPAADVASISVKSATQQTCALDGWLTLGAGARVRANDPATTECPPMPSRSPGDQVAGWADLVALQTEHHTGARLGTLGAAMRGRTCGSGPGAAVAVADTAGVTPIDPDQTLRMTGCPVMVVDGGALPAARGGVRAAQVERIAQMVEGLRRTPRATVWLIGIADDPNLPGSDRQVLPALRLAERQTAGRWLTSDSTRRPALIQIADLTATLLAPYGGTTRVPLNGAPIRTTGGTHPDADAVVADRLAANDRFKYPQALLPIVPPLLGGVAALLAAWFWLRRTRAARRVATLGALTVGGFFSAASLATLTMWWRWPQPGLALGGVIIAFSVLIALVAKRASARWPGVFVAAVGYLTYTVDGLLGTPMQFGGLFAQGPVVGGRFYGNGNSAFAAYAACTLIVMGAVATRITGPDPAAAPRDVRLRAALATLGVGLVAVVVDGAPWFAADFGGMVSLMPVVALLTLFTFTGRASWKAFGIAAASAIIVVGLLSIADYLRPAGTRTHVGDFVARLLAGDATDTLNRKVTMWLGFVDTPLGVCAMLVAIVGMLAGALPGRIPSATVQRLLAVYPLVRPLAVSLSGCAFLGLMTNDAGPIIPLIMLGVCLPLLVATCINEPTPIPGPGAEGNHRDE